MNQHDRYITTISECVDWTSYPESQVPDPEIRIDPS